MHVGVCAHMQTGSTHASQKNPSCSAPAAASKTVLPTTCCQAQRTLACKKHRKVIPTSVQNRARTQSRAAYNSSNTSTQCAERSCCPQHSKLRLQQPPRHRLLRSKHAAAQTPPDEHTSKSLQVKASVGAGPGHTPHTRSCTASAGPGGVNKHARTTTPVVSPWV